MKILLSILSFLISINLILNENIIIYNLDLFGKISYDNNTKSYTVLNLKETEIENIYITYTIPNRTFDNNILNYSFTNEYPKDNITTNSQIKIEQQKSSSKILENNNFKYQVILYYNIKKEDKQYLVLSNFENIFNDTIVIEHTKNNSTVKTLAIICIVVGVITLIAIFIVAGKYIYMKKHDDLLKKEYGSSFVEEKENPSVIPPEDSPQENNKNEEEQLI